MKLVKSSSSILRKFLIFNFFAFLILGLFTFLLLVGCQESEFKTGKYFAGDIYASAEELNLGKTVYAEYCMACHGVNGDGNGVASKGLIPPPR